jgi:hypothetical protein
VDGRLKVLSQRFSSLQSQRGRFWIRVNDVHRKRLFMRGPSRRLKRSRRRSSEVLRDVLAFHRHDVYIGVDVLNGA